MFLYNQVNDGVYLVFMFQLYFDHQNWHFGSHINFIKIVINMNLTCIWTSLT